MTATTLTPTLSRKRERESTGVLSTLSRKREGESTGVLPLPLAGEGWGEGRRCAS
jgi:hypothetical protein